MKKPSLAIVFGHRGPPGEEPDEEGEHDEYSSEAEEHACRELAEILDVPEEKYDAFREALDAWYQAKESEEDDEEPTH